MANIEPHDTRIYLLLQKIHITKTTTDMAERLVTIKTEVGNNLCLPCFTTPMKTWVWEHVLKTHIDSISSVMAFVSKAYARN